MRRGARDYVEKPWDNTRLVSILATQVPAYTKVLIGGGRGDVPTPLVLGSAAMRRELVAIDRTAKTVSFAPYSNCADGD